MPVRGRCSDGPVAPPSHMSLSPFQASPIGAVNPLNPQLAALALRTQGSAQRQSFAYVPPEARRSTTPVRAVDDSTPPAHKAGPGENGAPVAKPEGPKMVRMWEGPAGIVVVMVTCV